MIYAIIIAIMLLSAAFGMGCVFGYDRRKAEDDNKALVRLARMREFAPTRERL